MNAVYFDSQMPDEERLDKQRLRELAESSPIVQQMVKTFRGEIVDVRREGDR